MRIRWPNCRYLVYSTLIRWVVDLVVPELDLFGLGRGAAVAIGSGAQNTAESRSFGSVHLFDAM